MASYLSPLLPIIALTLLLSSVAPSYATRHRPLLPSRINPLCLYAPYPLLCSQLPPARSPRSLAELAARASASKISAAIPVINKIRSAFSNNKRMVSTLDICAEVYSDAVYCLNSAVKGLRSRGGNINDVMANLSASLTDVSTCDDAFDEDPSLFNPITHISRNLNRLVTNSLTLASAVKRSA